MRIKIRSVCVSILLLLGICLLGYPAFSNWVNVRHQSGIVTGYKKAVESLEENAYKEALEAARIHNEKLANTGSLAAAVQAEKSDDLKEYTELLNPDGSGMIGVIRIPKVKMESPIYHTTDKPVLQKAVGHYVGSSLPVGGSSTHSILSGHTGLPSAKLFTDIDRLERGDRFYVDVLKETFVYEVDQIKVVLPDQVDSLNIEKGKDYITLVTCTPYGINSHRLLVRGHRVDDTQEEAAASEEVRRIDKRMKPLLIFAVVVFGLAALIGTLYGRYRALKSMTEERKRKRRKKKRRKRRSRT